MQDIRVCKVLNKLDESNSENLVVCSVWEDAKLKVYIVKDNKSMLFGEEAKEQLKKYAKTFDKSLDTYLQESKDILCGIKSDVEFFLTDNKFYWKKDKWPLGQINVKPVQNVTFLISFILNLIEEYIQNKKTLDNVQKEYENGKLIQSEIIQKLNECQTIKDQLENNLYKKFVLVLNSKKAMIKYLKDKLQKLENSKSIFNELTDESDSDLEEKSNVSSHSNKKRACEGNIQQKSSSKRKKGNGTSDVEMIEKNNSKINVFSSVSDNLEAIPSTSNNIGIANVDEETPDLISGESECEFELKFDEDKLEDNEVKKSATSEEESEEMF